MCGEHLEQQLLPGWTASVPQPTAAKLAVLSHHSCKRRSSRDGDVSCSGGGGGGDDGGGDGSDGGGGGGGSDAAKGKVKVVAGESPRDGSLVQACDFKRIDGSNLSQLEFVTKFASLRKPVVLTGMTNSWMIQKWVDALQTSDLGTAMRRNSSSSSSSSSSDSTFAGTSDAARAYVRSMLGAAVLEGTNSYMNLDRQPRDVRVHVFFLRCCSF